MHLMKVSAEPNNEAEILRRALLLSKHNLKLGYVLKFRDASLF